MPSAATRTSNCIARRDGNTAADVHAGRTVAQTVNTTPGASYTFSIRHSGRSKGNAGGVTLLTGPDKDHLTPVKLTRTTVSKTGQKYGDKTGDVGTVAYTHSDSMDATEGSHEPWDHSDDWESYEGHGHYPSRTIPHDDRLQGRRQGRYSYCLRQ